MLVLIHFILIFTLFNIEHIDIKYCSHLGSQWLTSIWDAVCSCSYEVKKGMDSGILAVFLPMYKECKKLFTQSQKTISLPTVLHLTLFAFFIWHLVQNSYSLSLYQDHTPSIYSECILGLMPSYVSVSRMFSCCISHGLLPRKQSMKHPSHMLFACACFLVGRSNHLGFQTLV